MKTKLEEYTGLSRSDLYDFGSGNRRKCIWKIGDLVQVPSNVRSRDAGCYGKIVSIEKKSINEPNSSSDGDSYWLCCYEILGPETKSNQIGKVIGARDYCFSPYEGSMKSNFSDRVKKLFSFKYHIRLTDRNDKSKSVSIDNLEAGTWQEAVDKVIVDHPEFGLKPGDYDGSNEVEVHWNYDGDTLKSF